MGSESKGGPARVTQKCLRPQPATVLPETQKAELGRPQTSGQPGQLSKILFQNEGMKRAQMVFCAPGFQVLYKEGKCKNGREAGRKEEHLPVGLHLPWELGAAGSGAVPSSGYRGAQEETRLGNLPRAPSIWCQASAGVEPPVWRLSLVRLSALGPRALLAWARGPGKSHLEADPTLCWAGSTAYQGQRRLWEVEAGAAWFQGHIHQAQCE